MSPTLTRMRALAILHLLGVLGANPAVAFGQAAVTGAVRDASGGVMPGVTVEAASPALIEKVRSVVTDGGGRYRIEDLRPGVYRITFSRTGWQPYELHGVEVSGSLTVRVDAVLAIDRVTAEVEVSAARAIDVRTARREVSLGGTTIALLPTARTFNALLVLVPGVIVSPGDTVVETATTSFPIHGGRTQEGRLLLNGLNIGSPPSGNSATSYTVRCRVRAGGHLHHRERLGRNRDRRPRDADRAPQRRQPDERVLLRQRERQATPGRQPRAGDRTPGSDGVAVLEAL